MNGSAGRARAEFSASPCDSSNGIAAAGLPFRGRRRAGTAGTGRADDWHLSRAQLLDDATQPRPFPT